MILGQGVRRVVHDFDAKRLTNATKTGTPYPEQ